MVEQTGNLFEQTNTVICVTTNGYVNASGYAEPKSETASQAYQIWPGISSSLGENIRREGSICQVVLTHYSNRIPLTVVSFPTKPGRFFQKDTSLPYLPGWTGPANLDIIRHSAEELVELTTKMKWDIVYLPRVGCGSGDLKWKEVKKTISGVLDDRFIVLRLNKKQKSVKDSLAIGPAGNTSETGFLPTQGISHIFAITEPYMY